MRAIICPGQGVFNVKTLLRLSKHIKSSKHHTEFVRHMDDSLKLPIKKYLLTPDMLTTDDLSNLQKTSYQQPLLVLASYLLLQLNNYAITPDNTDFMVGHSMGELTLLTLQNKISIENSVTLAYTRGILMENVVEKLSNPTEFKLYALMIKPKDFHVIQDAIELNPHVNISNINGLNQIVISGRGSRCLQLFEQFKLGKISFKPIDLKVNIPFHNPVLDPVIPKLSLYISTHQLFGESRLSIPSISNLNGQVVKETQTYVDNFIQTTSKTVNFLGCLETLLKESRDDHLEIHNISAVSTNLVKSFAKQKGLKNITNIDLEEYYWGT
ncbi:BA75_05038T0 [Komagataella pastoris]|uniref:[acyl-carrier-protein] S-malonyltransferase n=1 Tax=Komagataella pastoris TaxID=4922 RepID=A0A1B2JI15_PICPA|nr:BA75_05038T0 [Komagataella pastoris]